MTAMSSDSRRSLLRRVLGRVPAYRPGKPPTPRPGVTTYKMASNENPYPPLPGVLEAAAEAAQRMNRYPDMFAVELTERIAAYHGLPAACIVVGTGSSGVLTQIMIATCREGDEVVYPWRSFEAYPIMVALTGANSIQVPLDEDGRHDLAAMAEAVTERTRVAIVCTPNNPTGPAVGHRELAEFIAAVPEDVLVVIDEAYVEFNAATDRADTLALYGQHPNVVVVRTFSKAFGLAGLRVGYAIARPEIAEGLRKCAVPFGVSAVAQAAAIASLDAVPHLQQRVEALTGERERVAAALRDQGWELPASEANFVWLPLGERALDFAAAADEAGLSVRAFDGEGVRVSVDDPAANDTFIEVAGNYARGAAAR